MSLKQELIDKQARFWVLMAGGSTLTAACEAVGVNRKSGCRWRQATGGRIPRKPPASSGRYLSLKERLQIADLHLSGAGVRAIAVGIGRSPATVSRELRRNGSAPTARRAGKYAPYAAQKQAELRGRRPKASKFDHAELATVVQSKLCVKWSPEQISLHLSNTTRYPDRSPCAEESPWPPTRRDQLYVKQWQSTASSQLPHIKQIRSYFSGPLAERQATRFDRSCGRTPAVSQAILPRLWIRVRRPQLRRVGAVLMTGCR